MWSIIIVIIVCILLIAVVYIKLKKPVVRAVVPVSVPAPVPEPVVSTGATVAADVAVAEPLYDWNGTYEAAGKKVTLNFQDGTLQISNDGGSTDFVEGNAAGIIFSGIINEGTGVKLLGLDGSVEFYKKTSGNMEPIGTYTKPATIQSKWDGNWTVETSQPPSKIRFEKTEKYIRFFINDVMVALLTENSEGRILFMGDMVLAVENGEIFIVGGGGEKYSYAKKLAM